MKIAILTKNDNSSPRILAESLVHQLIGAGVRTEVLYGLDMLHRMVDLRESGMSRHFWLMKKIANWRRDRKILKRLRKADAVIISECIPNAFWRKLYNVEKLKALTKKPVFIYEVYGLINAPTQIKVLQDNSDALHARYDGHLFVSPVTEIRSPEETPGNFCIGLLGKTWGLEPHPKKELMAVVDFAQPGYEDFREMQIRALEKAEIPFVSLETRYTIAEIREIYSAASIFFVQCPEAFGLPILECLCSGAQIFTADSSWPMSWRLDKEPQVHGKGTLPDCFTVYNNEDDLLQKLEQFKTTFDTKASPLKVFREFIEHYPSFYEGNANELDRFLAYREEKRS